MECLPSEQQVLVFKARESKRDRILAMFERNLGQEFSTAFLHSEFGTSFRTRVSEINRGDFLIRIRNKVHVENGGREASVYWSERR